MFSWATLSLTKQHIPMCNFMTAIFTKTTAEESKKLSTISVGIATEKRRASTDVDAYAKLCLANELMLARLALLVHSKSSRATQGVRIVLLGRFP